MESSTAQRHLVEAWLLVMVGVISMGVPCNAGPIDEAAIYWFDHARRDVETYLEVEQERRRRDFAAEDGSSSSASSDLSSVCGLSAVSTRLTSLKTLCPNISAYASGAMAKNVFFANFCTNGCDVATETSLTVVLNNCANNASWNVDATVWTTLDYVAQCRRTRRTCWTNATIRTAADSIINDCFTPVYSFGNFTYASLMAGKAACSNSSSCRARVAALPDEVSTCTGASGSTTKQLLQFFDALCSQPSDAIAPCYESLKSIYRVQCNASDSSSGCSSSGAWCGLNAYGTCEMLPMNRTFASYLCTSCIDALAANAAVVGTTPLTMLRLKLKYCSLADPERPQQSSYCFNVLRSFSGSLPTTYDGLEPYCSGDWGRCVPPWFAWNSLWAKDIANSALATCLASPSGTGPRCTSLTASNFRQAEIWAAMADVACARNSNGSLCYPAAFQLRTDYCLFTGLQGLCSVGCRDEESSLVNVTGCCLPLINRYLRTQSTAAAAEYLPSGVQAAQGFNGTITYSWPSLYSATLDRSLQPLNGLSICSNTSYFWAGVETRCPATASAVTASVPLALAWTVLSRDTTIYAKFLSSMRADVALSLGLSPDLLRNDALIENAQIQINVADTTSRRASATTSSSGASYRFAVDAGSNSSILASTFTTSVSSGTFKATSTAQTVLSSCLSCVDVSVASSSDSFLTLFAGLVSYSSSSAQSTAAATTTAPVAVPATTVSALNNTGNSTLSGSGNTVAPTLPLITQKAVGTPSTSVPLPGTDSPGVGAAASPSQSIFVVIIIGAVWCIS